MAQELPDPTQESLEMAAASPSLSRSGSASRLNAQAPEFVPRATAATAPPPPQMVPVIHVFAPPPPPPPFFAGPPPPPSPFEFYGFVAEHEAAPGPAEPEHASPATAPPAAARDGLSDEVVQKITKQVEYYFSDINLATTEHLMRFITKDPEGYVPISVIASFKKIKALVHNNSLLAMALRTSSKLIVSDDGKKVRRQQPFTESDVEELQSRIVVAENLPEDHCYQNLMKVFSAVGSVRTIRTCYPQTPNGTAPVTNRSAKLDMLFANKLHAFVEYDTLEDAEKAISELNDEGTWRSGLRVRLLNTCMTKGAGRGRKGGHEADGTGEEDDVSTSNQPNEKQVEDSSQQSEILQEHVAEENPTDKDAAGVRRGRGRGRGGRGRGRGYHHHNSNHHNSNRSAAHPPGTQPSSHPINAEQPLGANKQLPGPRMPDGTRGFTMGRGKLQILTSSSVNEA